MADTKVSALPTSSSFAAASLLLAVVAGTTVSINGTEIASYVLTEADAGLASFLSVESDNSGAPQIDGLVYGDRGTFAYAASVTLDTAVHTSFDQTNTLTGNIAITLSNGAGRKSGSVKVVQDGTGGRTATFTATGATMVNLGGSIASAASAYSIIWYEFSTVNSVLICSYSIGSEGGFYFANTDRLFGRDASGAGAGTEISLNATLEFTGSNAIQRAALTGDVTAPAGSNATTIATSAVTADKILDGTIALADVAATALTSGVYQPTLTSVANVDATTTHNAFYWRVGSMVGVIGQVNINPTTAGGTSTQVGVSLPVASNFVSTTEDGSGSGRDGSSNGQAGNLLPDTTNDRMQLTFLCANANDQSWSYYFAYQVL